MAKAAIKAWLSVASKEKAPGARGSTIARSTMKISGTEEKCSLSHAVIPEMKERSPETGST